MAFTAEQLSNGDISTFLLHITQVRWITMPTRATLHQTLPCTITAAAEAVVQATAAKISLSTIFDGHGHLHLLRLRDRPRAHHTSCLAGWLSNHHMCLLADLQGRVNKACSHTLTSSAGRVCGTMHQCRESEVISSLKGMWRNS